MPSKRQRLWSRLRGEVGPLDALAQLERQGLHNSEFATIHLLVASNERTVTWLYRLATLVLLGFLTVHLAFSSYYVYARSVSSTDEAVIFGIFNLAALIAEVYVSRIAFMLGSRAGQLRDIRLCLLLTESKVDLSRFRVAAQAIMSTRRSEVGLKILDVESIAGGIAGKATGSKSGDKDTA
jgi:hypothetical protein